MESNEPDLQLMAALRQGDDAALETLMNRHQEAAFRFIHSHVCDHADAVDLTQELFVRIYFKAGQFRSTSKFSTWMLHRTQSVPGLR